MFNLFKMDLYRMRKAKSFYITLLIGLCLALAAAPVEKLMLKLVSSMGNTIASQQTENDKQFESFEEFKSYAAEQNVVLSAEEENCLSVFYMDGLNDSEAFSGLIGSGVELPEFGSIKLRQSDVDKIKAIHEKGGTLQTDESFLNDITGRQQDAADANTLDTHKSEEKLSDVIKSPFPSLTGLLGPLLILLSVCSFLYADIADGYVKNIAGQMPRKSFTVLSKFCAVAVHNLVFMALTVLARLAGTLIAYRLVIDGGVTEAIGAFLLKYLLLQGVCAILMLVIVALRSKTLGIVLSVMISFSVLALLYAGLETLLEKLLKVDNVEISGYMPDTLLKESAPDTVKAICSALVTMGICVPLGMWLFDKNDIKDVK